MKSSSSQNLTKYYQNSYLVVVDKDFQETLQSCKQNVAFTTRSHDETCVAILLTVAPRNEKQSLGACPIKKITAQIYAVTNFKHSDWIEWLHSLQQPKGGLRRSPDQHFAQDSTASPKVKL